MLLRLKVLDSGIGMPIPLSLLNGVLHRKRSVKFIVRPDFSMFQKTPTTNPRKTPHFNYELFCFFPGKSLHFLIFLHISTYFLFHFLFSFVLWYFLICSSLLQLNLVAKLPARRTAKQWAKHVSCTSFQSKQQQRCCGESL